MTALLEQCESGRTRIKSLYREYDRIRSADELVRLWDGEMELHHVLGNEYEASYLWISNDTGQGTIKVPFDSPQGQWIYDQHGRMQRGEKRNVHITVDDAGARWGGRLGNCIVEHGEDGDRVVIAEFDHDYENLKWITVWSNPFFPQFFQAPRVFLLAGPVTWLLKTTLWLQLFRYKNPLVTIPDDPLDFSSYLDFLDQSTWDIVVKPTTFLEAAESGVVWGVVSSRWANFHDMAHVMLEDAELSIDCRRYLEGDPEPWPGANLRHGTLVIDILDKSGVNVGTAHGGSIFDGLFRTAAEFTDDFVDSTDDLVFDTDVPQDYFLPGHRLTRKEMPGVIYLEGEGSPIETSQFINSPAKGDTINAGGHSMPGVVCALRGNPEGTDNLDKPTKQFQRVSKPQGIFWATFSRSDPLAARSTHSSNPCMRTLSWRGIPSKAFREPNTQATSDTTNTSRTGRIRHTPSPPSWSLGRGSGPPKPRCRTSSPSTTAAHTSWETEESGTTSSTIGSDSTCPMI